MARPPQFGGGLAGCRTCCGIWLDNEASLGVVRGSLHPAAVELVARVDAYRGETREVGYRNAAPSQRRCPSCDVELQTTSVSSERVLLDVCPSHGTWFDRNELRTVLRAFAIDGALAQERTRMEELVDSHTVRILEPSLLDEEAVDAVVYLLLS
jgi:Zn-finger nucleic acid-binding protein